MRPSGTSGKTLLILGTILSVSLPFAASAASKSHRAGAQAAGPHLSGWRPELHDRDAYRLGGQARMRNVIYARSGRGRYFAGGMQCVPFARNASGIDLTGNAWTWWNQAAGTYERGSAPEPGSVLAFRANGTMRLGHVAVVSRVVNAREIEIDHANWGGYRGGVARNIPVVDVSPNNDWTAVRVALGRNDEFGSIYPTYGFIYDRPDRGLMVAAKNAPAPQPDLNPAPRDLRPYGEIATAAGYEEVAEAPAPHHVTRRAHHHRRY